MPEPIYEYHLLYYSRTGKIEPPLGGGWRIYKSRVSRTAIGATVLWRRSIDESVSPSSEVTESRTLVLDCISGNSMCNGPYGSARLKCNACSEYEKKYPKGKATFKEMLDGCEGFIGAGVTPGESDLNLVREVRLHVNLHGYPAITENQKSKIEAIFHSLFTS